MKYTFFHYRICWSGKWKDMGSEIGFQNGRHVVSLWRDLGCFNKFNIIYEVLRILGFDSNGSGNQGNIPDNKGYHRAYIHGRQNKYYHIFIDSLLKLNAAHFKIV